MTKDKNSGSSNNQSSNNQFTTTSNSDKKPITIIEVPNPPGLITEGFKPILEIKKDKKLV
jgi:hypothetical protein